MVRAVRRSQLAEAQNLLAVAAALGVAVDPERIASMGTAAVAAA